MHLAIQCVYCATICYPVWPRPSLSNYPEWSDNSCGELNCRKNSHGVKLPWFKISLIIHSSLRLCIRYSNVFLLSSPLYFPDIYIMPNLKRVAKYFLACYCWQWYLDSAALVMLCCHGYSHALYFDICDAASMVTLSCYYDGHFVAINDGCNASHFPFVSNLVFSGALIKSAIFST